ncbi:MAG: type II toxin-antitoxin system HicB family antitoxin [Nitrospirae bacterium]|nr:MAG: type II toxin-antitoxin system HicB family antitoxin [Nitrospirota bacterium]
MLNLKYSLVIEATEDPHFFAFYSPDLGGFTGTGQSIEDSLEKARTGMEEHLALMKERKLAIPSPNLTPTVTIKDTRPVRQGA